MLNYLHKRHLFRKRDPIWTRYYLLYQRVDAMLQRNNQLAKKIGSLDESEREQYRKDHPYHRIDPNDRKMYKQIAKTLNRRARFMLEANASVVDYNEKIVNYHEDRAPFSKDLLKLCLEKLVEFINEYQITELPEENKIAIRIDDYNTTHRKQLPKAEMVRFYKDLKSIGSFRDVGKIGHLSRATIYRYRGRFALIGITENNLIPLTEDGIPQADVDLNAYHSVHMGNARFTQKKKQLDIW